MSVSTIIVSSRDPEIIELCENLSEGKEIKIVHEPDVANFLISLQENDYHVVVFDCLTSDLESLKWIKLIRKIRPKIPLIVLSKNFKKTIGAKMYEEGTFYLCLKPIKREILHDVLSAAIKHFRSGVFRQKNNN